MRKYLNEIGIEDDHICIPGTKEKQYSKKAGKRFKKERKKYGFDSRETVALSLTSAMWLYEHLKMYVKVSERHINLDFNRFEISPVEVDERIWEEEEFGQLARYITIGEPRTMTQKEAIELCCSYLKDYILCDDAPSGKHDPVSMAAAELICDAKGQQAFRIYAELLPAMWRL